VYFPDLCLLVVQLISTIEKNSGEGKDDREIWKDHLVSFHAIVNVFQGMIPTPYEPLCRRH